MSNYIPKTKNRNHKKGMVIFVVLVILGVLGVFVTAYNFLVRGKSNESKEILRHLRATKCAQSVADFIITNLMIDIETANSDDNSAGNILKTKVFAKTDNSSDLAYYLKKEWYDKGLSSSCNSFAGKLVNGEIGKDTLDLDVEFGFAKVESLNSLKKRNSSKFDENVPFFDFEKVGYLTVKVTVKIGKTREVWQETRPFKFICPFPVPITKFSLYWNDGVSGDNFKFNSAIINSNTGKPDNDPKKPFLIDNAGSGSSADNADKQIWKKRGWIHVGGNGNLFLNRAGGNIGFGQDAYFSNTQYPLPNEMNFPDGAHLQTHGLSDYFFVHVDFGFDEVWFNPINLNTRYWKDILFGEASEFSSDTSKMPPYRKDNTNKEWWSSSLLHLFSNIDASKNSSKNLIPTITRVSGNVYDRFIRLIYLKSRSNSDFLAAVINFTPTDFRNNKEAIPGSLNANASEDEDSNSEGDGISNNETVDISYFFSVEKRYARMYPEEYKQLNDKVLEYLYNIDYEGNSGTGFRNIMSKTTYAPVHEIYSKVNANSEGQTKLTFDAKVIPTIYEKTFDVKGNLNLGLLPSSVGKLNIDSLGSVNDKTLGLSLRTCYAGDSTEIISLLNKNCGLDLNNLVYKIEASGVNSDLGNDLRVNSPGSIYSDGAIKVGNFVKNVNNAPMVILAENGPIRVKNSTDNEINAYLIALGEDGTVRPENNEKALKIRGGMAVQSFAPNNIPRDGGYLVYNQDFDPTGENNNYFSRCLGLVLGPKGGSR